MSLIAKMLVLLVFASAVSGAHAADPVHPEVVMIVRDPWAMVMGAESPVFALYSDGLVVSWRKGSDLPTTTRLSPAEHQALARNISPDALSGLDESYESDMATDQPVTEIFVWIAGKRTHVSVYGNIWDDIGSADRSPPAFIRAVRAIEAFEPSSESWLPDRIEVLIWPFDYSKEQPIEWPEDWPDLSQAILRPSGTRQIFIPASEYPRLRQLVSSIIPKQAIALGGKKWAISYRLPFPREAEWMR